MPQIYFVIHDWDAVGGQSFLLHHDTAESEPPRELALTIYHLVAGVFIAIGVPVQSIADSSRCSRAADGFGNLAVSDNLAFRDGEQIC